LHNPFYFTFHWKTLNTKIPKRPMGLSEHYYIM
jgi:hypothetical protein